MAETEIKKIQGDGHSEELGEECGPYGPGDTWTTWDLPRIAVRQTLGGLPVVAVGLSFLLVGQALITLKVALAPVGLIANFIGRLILTLVFLRMSVSSEPITARQCFSRIWERLGTLLGAQMIVGFMLIILGACVGGVAGGLGHLAGLPLLWIAAVVLHAAGAITTFTSAAVLGSDAGASECVSKGVATFTERLAGNSLLALALAASGVIPGVVAGILIAVLPAPSGLVLTPLAGMIALWLSISVLVLRFHQLGSISRSRLGLPAPRYFFPVTQAGQAE